MKKAALVIACLAVSWPADAMAQNYPAKPIKMIVPISVASITDVVARLTAQELEQRLGQSVIVINKPGAAMVLGGSECAKSDPDGYTLCVVSPDTMSFNPLTIPNLPYNPEKDFAPVIDMYNVTEGLMTPTAFGVAPSKSCTPRRQPSPANSTTARLASAPPPMRFANGSASIGIRNLLPSPIRA